MLRRFYRRCYGLCFQFGGGGGVAEEGSSQEAKCCGAGRVEAGEAVLGVRREAKRSERMAGRTAWAEAALAEARLRLHPSWPESPAEAYFGTGLQAGQLFGKALDKGSAARAERSLIRRGEGAAPGFTGMGQRRTLSELEP